MSRIPLPDGIFEPFVNDGYLAKFSLISVKKNGISLHVRRLVRYFSLGIAKLLSVIHSQRPFCCQFDVAKPTSPNLTGPIIFRVRIFPLSLPSITLHLTRLTPLVPALPMSAKIGRAHV